MQFVYPPFQLTLTIFMLGCRAQLFCRRAQRVARGTAGGSSQGNVRGKPIGDGGESHLAG